MVNSRAAGGDLTFHSGSGEGSGNRSQNDGSGGEGSGGGADGGGGGENGMYGDGQQSYGSQHQKDQMGAEELAARNEAELMLYKQIVGSILADEQELAALQRVQVYACGCALVSHHLCIQILPCVLICFGLLVH